MMLVSALNYLEIAICLAALCFLLGKGLWRDYWALGSFLAVRLVANTSLAFLRQSVSRLDRHIAYQDYFWIYWMAFTVESVLTLFIVYGLLRHTLEPLKGLQRSGAVLFGVVAASSLACALAPVSPSSSAGVGYVIETVSRLQRGQSLFTLCLLALVLFAMRSMGISRASKIFGVSLGLGLLALKDPAYSMSLSLRPEMNTTFNLINVCVVCAILLLWTVYLAMPEPGRPETRPQFAPLAMESKVPWLVWDVMETQPQLIRPKPRSVRPSYTAVDCSSSCVASDSHSFVRAVRRLRRSSNSAAVRCESSGEV